TPHDDFQKWCLHARASKASEYPARSQNPDASHPTQPPPHGAGVLRVQSLRQTHRRSKTAVKWVAARANHKTRRGGLQSEANVGAASVPRSRDTKFPATLFLRSEHWEQNDVADGFRASE